MSVTEQDSSAVSYGYDDIYQLTSETRTGTNAYTITYQYDDAGNRTQMVKNGTTTSYTYNNNNQLLTETTGGATVTYSYDLNGNLISKTAGGSVTGYAWDWGNRLLSVSEPGGETNYEYDGDGTRISKTQGGVKTKYINDAGFSLVQVLMETDNAGVVQATYNYGNDLISMKRADVNSFYHYDGLGSTRQLTDSSGTVAVSYTYDSFGNVIAQTAGGGMASKPVEENRTVNEAGVVVLACFGLGTTVVAIRNRKHGLIAFLCIILFTGQIPTTRAIEVDATGNPYGFTGEQQFGEANNLVFLRARYYKPSTGRFISRDPIGYVDGMNLYTYAKNNPVMFMDPSGLESCRACAERLAWKWKSEADNFIRHCSWSCEMNEECGGWCAFMVGWGHEFQGIWGGGASWDDIVANNAGRESACNDGKGLSGYCRSNCENRKKGGNDAKKDCGKCD